MTVNSQNVWWHEDHSLYTLSTNPEPYSTNPERQEMGTVGTQTVIKNRGSNYEKAIVGACIHQARNKC